MQKLSPEEMNRLSLEAFQTAPKFPFSIVLENIRSLNNVGSFFRTADAFRCEKIYLGGYTPCPPHREITRSALGAELAVSWEKTEDTAALLRILKSNGVTVIGVEQTHGSIPLGDLTPVQDRHYALVFGNEVEGVSDEVLQLCDIVVEIPQFGTKHSLNVAVSAGIVTWEFVKKITKK